MAGTSIQPQGVTTHLMCLTSSGGLPLFTRKKGDGEALPFSVVASLNGVYMFGKSVSSVMKSTSTENGGIIVWREFEDSITLIVSAFDVPESELDKFLEIIFNAMILHVGIQELKEPRNAERLKRDLRVCYPLLDRLLCGIHPFNSGDRTQMSRDGFQLVGMAECLLCHENNVLQVYLEAHVESLASMYGCVLVHGRIAVATAGWWTLTCQERCLLTLLISTDPITSLRDMPVFLPDKSPQVPFRLVTVQLVAGIEVLTLCGPTPSLAQVETLTSVTWRHAGDVLKALAVPRTLPTTLGLDHNVLAILLVNSELGKFVLCTDPHGENGNQASTSSHRASILHAFHRKLSDEFTPTASNSENEEPGTSTAAFRQMLETYWGSEFHKCHALLPHPSQLYTLYTAALPFQTIRALSKNTMKIITSEKNFLW